MTASPAQDLGFDNSTMDMEYTTQFQITGDTESEYNNSYSEGGHCSFGSDSLIIFLIEGIGVSFVSVIGIVGNTLSAIVLSRPTMRSSTSVILLGLSIWDFLVVLTALVTYGIPRSIAFFCVKRFERFYLTSFEPILDAYLIQILGVGENQNLILNILLYL